MPQAVLALTFAHVPPGAAVASQAVVSVTSDYVAQEGGTLDIPDGTLSGVEFPLPFGTVDVDGIMFLFKNTNNQDMLLRLNGSAGITRVAPGGILMIANPTVASGGGPTPLLAASVATTAAQVGAGTFNYYVFGS